MPSRPPPSDDGAFNSWLERSIQRPVYIDRSDGEKRAEEELIHERAKTERWNRWVSRAWFTLKIGVPLLLLGFFLGIGTALTGGVR